VGIKILAIVCAFVIGAIVCSLIGGCGFNHANTVQKNIPIDDQTTNQSAETDHRLVSEVEAPTQEQFVSRMDRNPFQPPNVTTPNKKETSFGSESRTRLLGFAKKEGKTILILEFSGKTHFATVGQSVSGWDILEVENETAILQRNGRRIRLELE